MTCGLVWERSRVVIVSNEVNLIHNWLAFYRVSSLQPAQSCPGYGCIAQTIGPKVISIAPETPFNLLFGEHFASIVLQDVCQYSCTSTRRLQYVSNLERGASRWLRYFSANCSLCIQLLCLWVSEVFLESEIERMEVKVSTSLRIDLRSYLLIPLVYTPLHSCNSSHRLRHSSRTTYSLGYRRYVVHESSKLYKRSLRSLERRWQAHNIALQTRVVFWPEP